MNGSGTTCISALQLGRQYIGIDMSKENCDLARTRIANYKIHPVGLHFKPILCMECNLQDR